MKIITKIIHMNDGNDVTATMVTDYLLKHHREQRLSFQLF